MAGILDPKKRFMDFQLTKYGRRQLAQGNLNFTFAVVSDRSTFYANSDTDVLASESAMSRICFESFNKSQDEIFVELDEDGTVYQQAGPVAFDGINAYVVDGEDAAIVHILTGSSLVTSGADAILKQSLTSLNDLQPLKNKSNDKSVFGTSISTHTFNITRESPFEWNIPKEINLDNLESVSQDMKLAEIPNFDFLPPINSNSKRQLRQYIDTRQTRPNNVQEFLEVMGIDKGLGRIPEKQSVDVHFLNPSPTNNIAMQVLNIEDDKLHKLVMVDYGELQDKNPFVAGKHIVFVGRLVKRSKFHENRDLLHDDLERMTLEYKEDVFINMFTLVFE